MLFQHVDIQTIAYALPPEVMSSAQIEAKLQHLYERLRLPEGRLELMTGIRERRLWHPGTMPSEAAARAGRQAMTQAGIAPSDVDCLLNCSVSRDFLEPATSTVVHRLLELPSRALNFDISNACLGMLTGILTAAALIELGQIKTALLVAGENSRPLLESTIHHLLHDLKLTRQTVKHVFASLTIGSAAAAIILTRTGKTRFHKLLGGATLANTLFNHLCRGSLDSGMGDKDHPLMETDSETLLNHGVDTAKATWAVAKQNLAWTNETPDVICTHQVGRVHRERLYAALELDAAKDFSTVEILGNCGSASLPLTAAMAAENGCLKPGMHLALLGIGSGINCTMLGVEW